jgi:hypothetical protein
MLVVQEKPDCPVLEIELSGFHGFKPPGKNLPLHSFSHFSLSLSHTHTRTTVRVTPKTSIGDSLVPSWNLGVLR